jgi:hypothetical protein
MLVIDGVLVISVISRVVSRSVDVGVAVVVELFERLIVVSDVV